jgi:Ca2+-transporting ATPase
MTKKSSLINACLSNDSEIVKNGVGKNIIPPPEKESLWKLYLEKFKDPIIVVLLVVFGLSVGISVYELIVMDKGWSIFIEPSGVMVALLLATGVGFIFELKADREFEILNKVKDSRPVKVFRRNDAHSRPRLMNIKKHDVVVGDLVKLESGDEVPADGTIKESTSLRVDESNFTGELYANKTTVEAEFDPDATYPSNFLLRGSTVIEGNAIYEVTSIGIDTEEGKGVAITREGSSEETPLNKQLAQLGRWISTASFIIASLIVVGRVIFYAVNGGFSDGASFIEIAEFLLASVMIAVTLIVVAVPEGLPMSVTVSLALSMRRMLKENNLVRKLHACETMGAATVICTDKTGTLTKNQMTVLEAEIYGGDESLELVCRNIAVNSTAEVFKESDGKISSIGNPTEIALLKWMHKHGPDYPVYREAASVINQIPFSTETKNMQTTAVMGEGSAPVRFVKGAPEILLDMCDSIAGDQTREHIEATLKGYQSKAMRTLAFACQTLELGKESDLVFLGIVGIADPIRDDVREAIETCKDKAGVRVIIVTGDTPGTANEIGRQIGLIGADEPDQTITGVEFAAMSHDEALRLVADPNFRIISRARPDDKARLVTLLQESGEVVSVTGDGTNDAPALSKAQVGLSMGDGTSRAKEASDITIIDNSFASINKAIMWGRSLYLNIQRFIIFQMTINLCACLIVLLGSFMGLDSPLTVTQMLWVNLIMDTFAAMALSSLPADKKVLIGKPRNPDSHIINRRMLLRIVGVGFVFFVLLAGLWQLLWHKDVASMEALMNMDSLRIFVERFADFTHDKAHLGGKELGIFFSIFVMLQFWNLFNAKYYKTDRSLLMDLVDLFRNPAKVKESYSAGFIWISLVIVLGQIIIVTFAGKMFSVEPLQFMDWVLILLATSPVLIVADVIRTVKNLARKTGK